MITVLGSVFGVNSPRINRAYVLLISIVWKEVE